MLLLPIVTAALLQGVPGHRYTFRLSPDHGDALVGTVREDGRNARMDFDAPRSHGDEYLLVREGQVIAIHPDDREYSTIDDSLFAHIAGVGLAAASDVGVVRFRVRDARFTPERLGAGDIVAGFATRRVRLTEEFTVDVRALGVWGGPVHMRVVTDYWVTDTPVVAPNPLIDMLSGLGSVLGQADPRFVRQEAAARRALFAGTPLRIVVSTWSSEDHADRPAVQTIEISDLAPASVDPAIFRIPAGFTRRDGQSSWRF